jgi:ribonuclease Z
MDFELLILGSNSAIPTAHKFPSAQLLSINQQYYLIDCGEGTQMQLRKYGIKFQRINHIFISHLHGDHYLGLMGLLSTMELLKRESPLKIYTHKGLKEIIDLHLRIAQSSINFPLEFIELEKDQFGLILEDKHVEVTTFPLSHRIPCNGYLFKESSKLLNINKEKIAQYDIELADYFHIKKGLDITDKQGNIIKNSWITDPPKPQRSFAYCSDTEFSENVIKVVSGVDLLYHEATFTEDMIERAKKTKHSTAKQAATVAGLASVKKLLIGHISARYNNHELLLNEAKEIFSNTFLAKEGEVFIV